MYFIFSVVQQTAVNNKPSTSTSSTKPLGRTKLPNFAAIHEKQFNKMENLVDHVKRKQERAKNLINSATKLKNGKKILYDLLILEVKDKGGFLFVYFKKC